MFLLRFFIGSWFGRIIAVLALLIGVPVMLIVITSLLLITGGPGPCDPGDGPITIDAANQTAFTTKFDAIDAALNSGAPAGNSFSESELSSRAQGFVDETGAPFKNVRICVHNGYAEGTAELSEIGIGVKMKIKGSVDLSGAHPVAHIDSIDLGNVPGFITGIVDRLVSTAVDNAFNDIDLKHKYNLTLSDGNAKIDGQP